MPAERLDRARRLMAERGIDVLLLSVGSDLPYLTGYRAMPLERLTLLVAPVDAAATLIVPRLEAPRVEARPDVFSIRAWGETEDPISVAAELIGGAARAAIGDAAWSVFLLELQRALPATVFEPASPLMAVLRMRKDPHEIALLREAAAATDRVVARLDGLPFAGRTEREMAADIAAMTVEEGHEEATFHIVASGPNGASPHHEASDRVIQPGDAVVVDFGGRHGGYCSDTTRTFSVGEPPPDVAAAFEVLHTAQQAAVASVRPGIPAAEIDRVARALIADGGYGEYFIHRTGHGIGMDEHEHPFIVEGNERPLEAGMTFSVEPGIYVPGRFGMRIEDIVAVSADGVDPLNRSPHHLHIVG
jgi:Xaa-Pro aminopeptidase